MFDKKIVKFFETRIYHTKFRTKFEDKKVLSKTYGKIESFKKNIFKEKMEIKSFKKTLARRKIWKFFETKFMNKNSEKIEKTFGQKLCSKIYSKK